MSSRRLWTYRSITRSKKAHYDFLDWNYISVTKVLHRTSLHFFICTLLTPSNNDQNGLVWCHCKIVTNHHLCHLVQRKKTTWDIKNVQWKQAGVASLIPSTPENHALLNKVEGFVTAFPLLLTVSVHHKVQLSHVVIFKRLSAIIDNYSCNKNPSSLATTQKTAKNIF